MKDIYNNTATTTCSQQQQQQQKTARLLFKQVGNLVSSIILHSKGKGSTGRLCSSSIIDEVDIVVTFVLSVVFG